MRTLTKHCLLNSDLEKNVLTVKAQSILKGGDDTQVVWPQE